MDKIDKELRKLTDKERQLVRLILEKIKKGSLGGLDVKKLKGNNDIFRVRKGDIRIIYRKVGNEIFLLVLERRSEKTYRTF